MNLRTTITFENDRGILIRVDHSQIVGLHGSRAVSIIGDSVPPDQLKVGDVTFRAEEVAEYLTRMTGLKVRIETGSV